MRSNHLVLIALILAFIVGSLGLLPAAALATGGPPGVTFAAIGTYSTGLGAASAETVGFGRDRMYVTNGADNSLDVVALRDASAPTLLKRIDLSPYGAGPNSVAVRGDLVAVAVEASPKTDPGKVLLFDGEGRLLSQHTVGALPDMLTFSPNGQFLLVANEGEPSDDYSVDPEGSVSILPVRQGGGRSPQAAIRTATFHAFERGGPREGDIDPRVRIFGPTAGQENPRRISQNLEPEYITFSPDGRFAYVTLQEANALGVIDMRSEAFVKILYLGEKDHSLPGNGLDASDRDNTINITNWPVSGLYQPDAIASFRARGQIYLITANEGDARVYPPADIPGGPSEGSIFNEEVRVGSGSYQLDPAVFPNAAELKNNANLGRLTVSRASGDENGDGLYERIVAFGARSFSIWTDGGELVYDSGDQLERITAQVYPGNFNASNTNNNFDDRSDNKGPEPEAVAVGQIGSRTYAFVGLERVGGVMIFDVTTPTAPAFVQYVNNRNFAQTPPGPDSGAEVIVFIPANESASKRARFLVANEVSGTVTIYEAGAPSEATTLSLLHNSDGESSLLPGTAGALTAGSAAAFKSVLDREIRAARGLGHSVMTVYAGDSFLASATLACSLPPNPATTPVYDAVAQRQMAYDAHVFGNHEFDFSPDFLERFIRSFAVNGRLSQPFLSANLDFGAEPGFADLIDGDGIIVGQSTDGRVVSRSALLTDPTTAQRFGVVGATTPQLPTISSPRNVAIAPDVASTARVVQAEIDRLLGLGVRKILFVSHLQSVANDRELIGLLRHVDIAVAGGGDDLLNSPAIPDSHEFLPGDTPLDPASPNNQYPAPTPDADGRTVYLVTTGGNYRYLGRVDATFDAAGEVASINVDTSFARRVVVSNGASAAAGIADAVTPDAGIVASVNTPVSACLAALANPIARTEVPLNAARGTFSGGVTTVRGVRSFETNSGNLVADGFVAAYDRYAPSFGLPPRGPGNLVIAVQNGGGIRQTGTTAGGILPPARVPVPGPLTRQNTLDLLAFLTNVTTVVSGVTPAELKEILEHSVSSVGGGQFLQVSGIELTVDLTRQAQVTSLPPAGELVGAITTPGDRVRRVVYTAGTADPTDDVLLIDNGAPVAGAPALRIVTNSFTADGGDNYPTLRAIAGKVLLPATYEQALVEYLLSLPTEEGLPTVQGDDPRYAADVNQRILGIPSAP
ncbi:MAG TPA: choice-of-anchor I family protein [Chloroflexaceae bacterium]|nr:choice-of-anchor I family protein [Chloroflexaceae bacterium]